MLDVARCYLTDRAVAPLYAQNLLKVAGRLNEEGISLDTISGERVNKWVASLPFTDQTKSNNRRMAMTLWKWAFESSLTNKPPRGVLSVRVRRVATVAWTRPQLYVAVKSADEVGGTFRGSPCKRSLFWGTLFRCAYETGFRFADLHELPVSSLEGGCTTITVNKTGQPITRPITPDLERRLLELASMAKGDGIFSSFMNRKNTFKGARKILDAAGLKGSMRYFRRSGATHCEIEQPGSAQAYLGHATPGLAARHYLDHRQLRGRLVAPPALGAN
jgi:integrase